MLNHWKSCLIVVSSAVLFGCASGPERGSEEMTFQEIQQQYSDGADVDDLNQQIMSMAVAATTDDSVYRLGVGDEISLDVMGVPDLSENYRIDGTGRASLPLIGELSL